MFKLQLEESYIKNALMTWNIFNKSQYNLKNILLDNEILKLQLILNESILVKLETDGCTYIYVENKDVNVSELNFKIIKENRWHNILNEINHFLNTKTIYNEDIILHDTFNIYTHEKLKCKGPINHILWKKNHDRLNCNSYINKYNIPQKLLFHPNSIFDMIKNEIININTNRNYEHYLIPINNNPYELKLHLKFNKKSKLYSDLEKVKAKWNFNTIQFNISLNNQLYPFIPPDIVYCKPKIQSKLMYILFQLDFLQFNNWNPTNSLEWIVLTLASIVEQHAIIDINNELNKNDKLSYHPLEYLMFRLGKLTKVKSTVSDDLKINYKKINYASHSPKSADKYWKSGIGYGHSNRKEWDIKEYIKKIENENKEISELLKTIYINLDKYKFTSDIVNIFENSCFINYVVNLFRGTTLMEINKKHTIFTNILPIIKILCNYKHWSKNISVKIYDSMKNITDEVNIILANEITRKNLKNINFFAQFATITDYWKEYINKFEEIKSEEKVIISTNKEKYKSIMKSYQFGQTDIINNSRHCYIKDIITSKPNIKTIQRLIQEIPSLKNNLPLSWSSTIFVKCDQNKINCLKCVIIGPNDTPYMNGVFEFDVYFPDNYPNVPPKVLLYTTGKGTVRFNPNLYVCGKVCLSLLGTWSGQGGESWIIKSSTFLQVLVSIQSLILVDKPYFNEPGWEKQMNTKIGQIASFKYNDNIRLQTMRWGILDQINNPIPGFEDMIKNHFKMKKQEIISTIDKWIEETKSFDENMKKLKAEIIQKIDSIDI